MTAHEGTSRNMFDGHNDRVRDRTKVKREASGKVGFARPGF